MKDLFSTSSAFRQQKKEYMEGRFNHAYLVFSGDSLSNEKYCLFLSEMLLCENHDPCGICGNCAKIKKDTHPDVLVYPKEKTIMVEDTENIIENANIKPALSDIKIFILNNFDMATVQAQNKLLKLIEEPPKNVYFILNATNMNKVLKTIISRTNKVLLEPLNKLSLKNYLNLGNLPAEKLALEFGNGWLGKTNMLLNKKDFDKIYDEILSVIMNMKSSKEVVRFSTLFYSSKEDINLKLELLYELYSQLLKCKIEETNFSIFKETKKEYSIEALRRILISITETKKKKDYNVNIQILIDNLFLKILEVKYLCK